MNTYLLLKWVHIVSSTLLFGTGLGSAFCMFMANRRGEVAVIYFAARHVVIADWLFTTPAIVIQLATGLAMALSAGYQLTDAWLFWALMLYGFAGACWIPVVVLQMRMRDIAKQAVADNTDLPQHYWSMERMWTALGCLAFPAVLVIFYLMVFKPV